MALLLSLRERAISDNSLVVLLQALVGAVTTVELRDESALRGRVVSVDAFMNVRLEEVELLDRRGNASRLRELFVTGRHVRYVHIPEHVDIRRSISEQLSRSQQTRGRGAAQTRREFSRRDAK